MGRGSAAIMDCTDATLSASELTHIRPAPSATLINCGNGKLNGCTLGRPLGVAAAVAATTGLGARVVAGAGRGDGATSLTGAAACSAPTVSGVGLAVGGTAATGASKDIASCAGATGASARFGIETSASEARSSGAAPAPASPLASPDSGRISRPSRRLRPLRSRGRRSRRTGSSAPLAESTWGASPTWSRSACSGCSDSLPADGVDGVGAWLDAAGAVK